jgi:hypothetical protein
MSIIRVHEFTSIDGVIDAPTWTLDFGYDPAMGRDIGNLMSSCNAILLGRNTYEMFEPASSTRTAEEDPGAPFMNESTKYVISSTLTAGTWQNTKVVGPYSADAIRRVKAEVGGGIYVSGSATLRTKRSARRRRWPAARVAVAVTATAPIWRAASSTTARREAIMRHLTDHRPSSPELDPHPPRTGER